MTIKEEIIKYIETNWPNTTKPSNESVPFPFSSPSINVHYVNFYYWDNYFINKGLLLSGMVEQATNNIENITYFINKYGYMPNAEILLNRSQPPVYPLCVYDLYQYTQDKGVILKYIDTCIKEYNFFQTNRMTPIGLNAFGCSASDESLMREYRGLSSRVMETSDGPKEQLVIAKDILAIAESGLDFNMRFKTDKSKIAAHEFAHLDLNCFLYKNELVIGEMLHLINRDNEANRFKEKAMQRKELINRYFFDEQQGIYADYNFVKKNHSHIVTAVSLYPYAFGISDDKESALRVLKQLELENGLSAAAYRGDDVYYQWDYPVLWAETTYFAYLALINANLKEEAERIKNKFMNVIEKQFEATHELWEKYDARDGSIVNVEYNAPPFMGWTAAIYQLFVFKKD